MENRRGAALITGASRGIGRELARLFARDGQEVVLVARSEEELQALARDLIATYGAKCHVIACDLLDPAAPAALKARLDQEGVTVGVLVNNAGFGDTGAFHTLDRQRQLGQVQLNIAALTDLTHLFLPKMIEQGQGRILNIASTAGFQPGPYMAVYYATKAYVISFSEAISHELRGTGVTVTAHCPGATDTHFAAAAGNDKTMLFQRGQVASAEDVAADAYAAMLAGRPVAIHGVLNWLGAFSVRLAPRAVVRALAARINS
jgi:uncharacterized protein